MAAQEVVKAEIAEIGVLVIRGLFGGPSLGMRHLRHLRHLGIDDSVSKTKVPP